MKNKDYKNKYLTLSFLLLLGSFFLSNVAHALEGNDLYCVYSDVEYSGDSYCNSRKEVDWVGWNWYGDISSIKVKQGYEIVAFDYAWQFGYSTIIDEDTANLGEWNDRIASFYVRPKQVVQDKVCFYSRKNYKGERFCTTDSQFWLGWYWNNRVSSVSIPAGLEVKLYSGWGFYGRSVVLKASTPSLKPFKFNNRTSSFEILESDNQNDEDADGVLDSVDACPNTPLGETVDDKGCSLSQLDSDNDGVNDNLDKCPNTPQGQEVNSDGCSPSELDDDQDGVNNSLDKCPGTPSGEAVNSDGCAQSQLDADNDGVADNLDQCPATPSGEAVNAQGCSASQLDADNDGVNDALDQCPNTPQGETVNDNGCSLDQIDTDNDGVPDYKDAFPNDPNESSDLDGDGVGDNSDPDRDGDGVANEQDVFPNDPTESSDLDGDGIGDNSDADRDGDGVANDVDAFPNDPNESSDIDGDGVGDNADPDRDGDGVPNAEDAFPDDSTETSDLDKDGIGDNADPDRDGDGVPNEEDYFPNDPDASSVPTVTIDSPSTLTTFGSSPITVKGTISDPNAKLILAGVEISHTNGKFEADVAIEEGINTIIARAIDQKNHEGIATITVSLDKTPPTLTIEAPEQDSTVYQDTVAVTGLVNDIVRGTVSEEDAKVTVNGVLASVSNRYFLAENVPLQAGENIITVLAEDGVGNSTSKQIRVNYQPQIGKVIDLVSGQNQTQVIKTILTEQLQVKLTDNNIPVADKTVVYRVVQGDGLLNPDDSKQAASAIVKTNQDGVASVPFKLGSRAGKGNHRVRARAVGFEGEVIFNASADYGDGNTVGVIAGNNQRTSVRQPLPSPFVVAITDSGANLVPNADVEFKVVSGTGTFNNGEQVITVKTDVDGRASAQFIAGSEEGLDVQQVKATLVGTTASAGFTVSAFMPGDPGDTKISGVVLDNQDKPLKGVTIRVDGMNRQAITDEQGQFTITEAPVGPTHLLVEGSTTSRPGEWPSLSYNIVTVPGVDNPLASPIYLVEIDTQNAVFVGAEDKVVSHPDIPGFELKVKAGSVTFPNGSKTGNLSITKVNANKVPMPPPNGMQPQLIVTIQPHGAKFDPPAELTIPNTDGHAPGAEIEMYSYDHDLEEFVTIGLGTVSKDGSTVTSNVGTGVIKAGWHCGSQPGGSACCISCGQCESKSESGCSCQFDAEACAQPDDDPCDEGGEGRGCPVWSVSKKTLNMYVVDTPIWYDSPVGPSMNMKLTYNVRQRNGAALEMFGNRWLSRYGLYVYETPSETNQAQKDLFLVRENGVHQRYYAGSQVNGRVRYSAYGKDAHYIEKISEDNYRWVMSSGKVIEFSNRVNKGSGANEISALFMTKMTDVNGKSMLFAHDQDGRLVTIIDAVGRETTLTYNNQNFVQKVTDPFGRTALFGYDAAGNLTEITDMGGYKSTLTYENQIITSITRPQFGTWKFKTEKGGSANKSDGVYPKPDGDMRQNYRVTVTDPNNDKTEYYYDIANDQTWMVKSNDYKEYETSELSNKNQPKEIYKIYRGENGWTRIGSTTNQLGYTESKTYNDKGYLRSVTHKNGTTDFYEYNQAGQLSKKIIAKGTTLAKLYEYEYLDSNSSLVTKETGPSVAAGKRTQTVYQYDANRNLISQTKTGYSENGAQLTRKTSYTYNDHNQLLKIDGPRTDVDDVTTFEYYDCVDPLLASCNQLRTIINAKGHVTTINNYARSGLVSKTTSPNGLVTETKYDALDRVVEVAKYSHAENKRVISYTYYGAKKHLKTVTMPNGLILNYNYDSSEQLISIAASTGERITYNYDKNGNLVNSEAYGVVANSEEVSEQLQLKVSQAYNELDQLNEVNRAGSITKINYNPQGLVNSQFDPNRNREQLNIYDDLNRLTKSVDALNNDILHLYNVMDLPTVSTATNGVVTHYRYNDFGEVIQEVSPDRGTLIYSFDSAGNRVKMVDARGIVVDYEYDELGRVLRLKYPDEAENITYSYDDCANGKGMVCAITDPSGLTEYEYDSYKNIARQTKTELGRQYTISYQYDSLNAVSSITYPSGLVVNYQHDLLKRVKAISTSFNGITKQVLTDVRYRIDGKPIKQVLGNGLVDERHYDLQGRLTHNSLGEIYGRSYIYDSNGNPLSIGGDTNVTDQTIAYDILNRVVTEGGVSGNQNYTYDPNGNRLTHSNENLLIDSTDLYSYKLNSNQLVAIGDGQIELDEVGNTISDISRSYDYNQRNQLRRVTYKGEIASYQYNASNQRTRKKVANDQTVFIYDQQGKIIAEYKNGELSSETIWTGWQPVAQINSSKITFLSVDHLGAPRVGTNESAIVVWAWRSDVFGSTMPDEDVDNNGEIVVINNRFVGQYHDVETGLNYNWYRYYDASTGRYISSDPIGLKGGFNTFAYADLNPLTNFDLKGLYFEGLGRGAFGSFPGEGFFGGMFGDDIDGTWYQFKVLASEVGECIVCNVNCFLKFYVGLDGPLIGEVYTDQLQNSIEKQVKKRASQLVQGGVKFAMRQVFLPMSIASGVSTVKCMEKCF